MRRFLNKRSVVLIFVLLTALPALAAPRQDDGPFGRLERIIKKIVRQIVSLDDVTVLPGWVKP